MMHERNTPVDMMKTQPTGVVWKSCKQLYRNEGKVIEKFPRYRSQEAIALYMVAVAQLVRAPDCDSGGYGFDAHRSPNCRRIGVKYHQTPAQRIGVTDSTKNYGFFSKGSNPLSSTKFGVVAEMVNAPD